MTVHGSNHLARVSPSKNVGLIGLTVLAFIEHKQTSRDHDQTNIEYYNLGKVKFQHVEDVIYNSISFLSHHTYLGMPQLKVTPPPVSRQT